MAETVRDAFEEWAHADHRRLEPNEYEADDRTPGNNHYYDADTTNQAYIGWCAAWNRRATDPAVAELVEALRRSYARLGDAATRINTLPRTTDTLLEVNLRQERSRIESLLAKHAAKP